MARAKAARLSVSNDSAGFRKDERLQKADLHRRPRRTGTNSVANALLSVDGRNAIHGNRRLRFRGAVRILRDGNVNI